MFQSFANETDIGGLLEAVKTYHPIWVEIHNWHGEVTTAKRWMATAPECAQHFFENAIVPFLKKRGFYTTQHDIRLGRGVAVLRFFYPHAMHIIVDFLLEATRDSSLSISTRTSEILSLLVWLAHIGESHSASCC